MQPKSFSKWLQDRLGPPIVSAPESGYSNVSYASPMHTSTGADPFSNVEEPADDSEFKPVPLDPGRPIGKRDYVRAVLKSKPEATNKEINTILAKYGFKASYGDIAAVKDTIKVRAANAQRAAAKPPAVAPTPKPVPQVAVPPSMPVAATPVASSLSMSPKLGMPVAATPNIMPSYASYGSEFYNQREKKPDAILCPLCQGVTNAAELRAYRGRCENCATGNTADHGLNIPPPGWRNPAKRTYAQAVKSAKTF